MQRIREKGTVETIADTPQERIAAIKQVITEGQYAKIDGCMCDLFSASTVIAIYDALNDENKAKFSSLPWPRMATVAFSLT